jgi:hypothetical protein
MLRTLEMKLLAGGRMASAGSAEKRAEASGEDRGRVLISDTTLFAAEANQSNGRAYCDIDVTGNPSANSNRAEAAPESSFRLRLDGAWDLLGRVSLGTGVGGWRTGTGGIVASLRFSFCFR